jgi:UDP-glucose 4-epimerase
LYKELDVPVWIVRLFNTVGPGQMGKYGMVLPRFIWAAINDEPIDIYGSGLQTRCFAHVVDVVDAIFRVSECAEAIGRAVNIGNPQEISILDLANKVIHLLNSRSEVNFIPYDVAYAAGFEDMKRRVPDISLLKGLTGWTPNRSLDQIIVDTANFMRQHSR